MNFKAASIIVKQSTEDADTLSINTSITVSYMFDYVIVVGEDIDLLVILICISTQTNIYFLKSVKGTIAQRMYSINSIADKIVAENILFFCRASSDFLMFCNNISTEVVAKAGKYCLHKL